MTAGTATYIDCDVVSFPNLVKRYRDGRVMLDRQKQPTRDVGSQYIRWFDEYAGEYFKITPEDQMPYICGERCWQLRCEYLHQNKGFLNDEDESRIRFHLGVNCVYAENDAGNCDASTCIRTKGFSMMKMRVGFDSILE